MRFRLATALLVAWLLPVTALSQALKYELRVEAPRELRQLLAERLPLARWQADPHMDEALLIRLVAEAEEDVREAAATLGFFSARVSSSIDRSTQPWTVVLQVNPGEPARVAQAGLDFSGPAASDTQALPLLERIRRGWTLRSGSRFTQDAWNQAKRDATGALARWRYPAAQVARSRADVDPKLGEARLQVEIDSGPPFRYGDVEVRGAERYPQRLIAGLSPTAQGEFYEREQLDLYERRLLATGYFVSAQAGIDADPERAGAAPVRVAVLEGRSQQFETGLSFNTDVGARAEARYRNMDLFDSAYRFKGEVQFDRRIRQGRLDLDSPPRPGGRWQSAFAQARETSIQNEDNVEYSAGLAHNWGLGGPLSALLVSAHWEEQRLAGLPADQRHAVYFGYRTQWRDTDSWEAPRRGYFAEASLGGAPGMLASRQFLRATARGLLLVPLGRHGLQLRAEAGVVRADSREGIPSSFLFRTGGDQTIRGYAFESRGVPRGDAVIGGRYLALASAEYTHWVGENWGVATFVDAGDAWDSGRFKPVVGAGAGVRFRTPIGPVRGDLAHGFEDRKWRLHFSVGFNF